MRFVQQKFRSILILVSMILIWVIKCHHFNMEQYIPYSLTCDLFIRNLETYLHLHKKTYIWQSTRQTSFDRYDYDRISDNMKYSNKLRVTIASLKYMYFSKVEIRIRKIAKWKITDADVWKNMKIKKKNTKKDMKKIIWKKKLMNKWFENVV